MPRREYDEDLFKDTTMTFGEHLEELRVCLFRAIAGLAVGFLLGLLVGRQVVEFIQYPLKSSLEAYVEESALADAEKTIEQLRAQGKPLPSDMDKVRQLVKDNLLPEEIFIQPDELARALKEHFGGPLKDFKLPEPERPAETDEGEGEARPAETSRDDLIRTFIWRNTEADQRVRVTTLNPQEAFMIWMKASLLMGVLVASPWIFYQIWAFVAAGLYPHEKYYVHVFLPVSLGLFLGGAALAFFAVFPPVLQFLFSFNRWMGIEPDLRISEWLSFVLILPLGFGIAFQLPLVMLFLERIGIFTAEAYLASWRVSVLVIFVISMILTPADPYSIFLMAVPLLVLYIAGVLMCKFMPRRKSPFNE